MTYKTITASSEAELDDKVASHRNDGWQVQGGVSVTSWRVDAGPGVKNPPVAFLFAIELIRPTIEIGK